MPGWRPPVAGPLTVARPFDPPATPYGPGHRGVDLVAPPQAAVLAAGAGEVSFAGPVAGRGVVVVSHSGSLRTTYEPVTAAVAAGDQVAAGQLVGWLEPGHAGCPGSACLHWGLRHGEAYQDPLRLLAPPPVRLLPLG
jgi:murein DD-endopeptidase MepM/ murein hydrolase activator NlpD